ncbi:MAG TPA: hypothetical protein VND90_07475 [Terracidiphilus sp.]|nr:hypothetical protein [Terracidiphilus sp.]
MGLVQLPWNPFDAADHGPCINVVLTNTDEAIEAGGEIGLQYPEPVTIRALIDTGSPFTIVNRVYAKSQKLILTNPRTEIRTLGGQHPCGEHSGALSFPETSLRRIPVMRILSGDFGQERFHSCLIGRDVLRYWKITFDGHKRLIRIEDQA